jgi:hypothetical protein
MLYALGPIARYQGAIDFRLYWLGQRSPRSS